MATAVLILIALVLGIAIFTDLRSGRIPNSLTFSVMALSLIVHAGIGGLEGVLFSLAGLSTGFGLFILVYLIGGMGAGDVKLMAAVGSILGTSGALVSGILAIVVGGIYALGAMCYQWGFVEMCRKLALATYGIFLPGGKGWSYDLQLPFRLRYGLAIAAGTLLFSLGFNPFGG